MIRAILFDLDGTLVDSLADLANAMNFALQRHGFATYDEDEYRMLVGNGVAELVRLALPEQSRDAATMAAVRTHFSEHYSKHYADNTAPYEGILSLLAELKKQKRQLAVISNKPDAFAKEIVRKLFPHDTFGQVIGQSEGIPKKPDPTMARLVMRELGVAESECIFVGDSDVDIVMAHNAGLYAAGCAWGFRGREELERAGADTIITAPTELIQVIAKQS